eukprot:94871_1
MCDEYDASDHEPKFDCGSLIIQGLATIFSAISTITIINLWKTDDHLAMGIVIIVFGSLEFLMHIVKILYVLQLSNKTISTVSKLSKIKAIVIGFVDAVFDIIVATAIIDGVTDFIVFNVSESLFVAIGTLTGLSEEIVETVVEIFFFAVDEKCGKCFWFLFVVTVVEILGAFIEVIVSVYLVANLKHTQTFMVVAITVLIATGCCICCIFMIMFYPWISEASKRKTDHGSAFDCSDCFGAAVKIEEKAEEKTPNQNIVHLYPV